MRIYDVHDLKTAAHESGSHYFSPDTMRYFSSRLIDVEPTSADTLSGLFLTSERDKWSDLPREYSVRAYEVTRHEHEGGSACHTFNAEKIETHETLARARAALRKHAAAERLQS